ncbi:hypothetical protein K431DRAFT_200577, partial [Polychaeton citri CBS 116435]
ASNKRSQTVLPASEFLQEKLLERRARNTRPKRRSRYTDIGPQLARDDDIFLQEAEESRKNYARLYDSSPIPAPVARTISDAGTTASSERRRRQMGAKELDAQMDRLTKENFALKLELDHRRENTAKLQEQLESMQAQTARASKIESEHAELLHINSQLVTELEKRDKAIEEAMDIICDLEDKVAFLEENACASRPTTANADSGYAGTESHEVSNPSSPPELQREARSKNTRHRPSPIAAASVAREPSFMASKKPSTQALRNVYLQTGQELQAIKSFHSLISQREGGVDIDEAVLNSPRLSVLSESSFESMYSPKKANPDRHVWEGSEDDGPEHDKLAAAKSQAAHLREDSISRVSQWMAERELDEEEETPSKPERVRLPTKDAKAVAPPNPSQLPKLQRSNGQSHFQSLNDALSSAKLQERPTRPIVVNPTSKPYQSSAVRQMAKHNPKTPTMGGAMFGTPLLPPTPESASTRMLRGSRSTIADEPVALVNPATTVRAHDATTLAPRHAAAQVRSPTKLAEAFDRTKIQQPNPAYSADARYRRHQSQAAKVEDSSSSEDSSEEESDDDEGDDDGDEDDDNSETVRDFMLDYDGYPDGNSILHGTPSRFLKQPKDGEDMFFNHNNISPPRTRKPEPPRRSQTSTEMTTNLLRPVVSRAETSPNQYAGPSRVITTGPRSPGEPVMSPTSVYSGSSSNGTIVQNQAQHSRNRSLSPEVTRSTARAGQVTSPSRSQIPTSPGSNGHSFSQKTQKLFRRLSNSHERSRDRETSPLPGLTRTPSSAYVN